MENVPPSRKGESKGGLPRRGPGNTGGRRGVGGRPSPGPGGESEGGCDRSVGRWRVPTRKDAVLRVLRERPKPLSEPDGKGLDFDLAFRDVEREPFHLLVVGHERRPVQQEEQFDRGRPGALVAVDEWMIQNEQVHQRRTFRGQVGVEVVTPERPGRSCYRSVQRTGVANVRDATEFADEDPMQREHLVDPRHERGRTRNRSSRRTIAVLTTL